MTIDVLVADGFQDSEYFLPKCEIEKMGVQTEVAADCDKSPKCAAITYGLSLVLDFRWSKT